MLRLLILVLSALSCLLFPTIDAASDCSRHVNLYNTNFIGGTYRITESGCFILREDIVFGPRPENDYWVPRKLFKSVYPASAFYLGFFAAITIEADDVHIDLNGFEIRQSDEFYLLQRFFNAIELNNRVFVENNGVSSLNIQKNDELVEGEKVDYLIKPERISIMNGKISHVSHAGIHGNGVTDLKISNITIEDFEVAGIQCNGCQKIKVQDCVVGPSATTVPTLATFSNARFLEFYTRRLVRGFSNESPHCAALESLVEEKITFADRPKKSFTLLKVFKVLGEAIDLYKAYVFEGTIPGDEESILLLEEAKKVFDNPSGLTDGSVQYGIFFNRLGTPTTDENFHGAGRETKDIKMKNVTIHGLHANPVEVAALMTEQGTFMQGPARDLIRIYDITSDNMRSLHASFYKGNFLWDAYFAFWKLSNEFYKVRIFHSECGSFPTNASFPMNLKGHASYNEPTCAQLGSSTDETLTGRDVSLLQKRYFGGLQMTQQFYEWATISGTSLDNLLKSPSHADELRSGARHKIVCGHDTMFHQMHGVVGLKVVEAQNVITQGVEISDLKNVADFDTWACRHKWQLQPSGEDIKPVKKAIGPTQSSMVRGVEVIRSDKVHFFKVDVFNLSSSEGFTVGFDIISDDNDRTDHDDDNGLKFKAVTINDLSSAKGSQAFKMSGPITTGSAAMKGVTVGKPEETDASLRNPRVVLNYANILGGPFPVDPEMTHKMFEVSTIDTERKIRAFRAEALGFLESHYGVKFEDGANENYGIYESIPFLDQYGDMTDSYIPGIAALDNNVTQYHGSSICISDADGKSSNCSNGIYPIWDFIFLVTIGPSGYTFHGVFGSDQGQFSPGGDLITIGVYVIEGINLPGIIDETNLEIKYFGECPIGLRQIRTSAVQALYINCALESELFGHGFSQGAYIYHFLEDGSIVVAGYPTMFFDDIKLLSDTGSISTQLQSELFDTDEWGSNDVRLTFVSDGTYNTLLSGVEALPMISAHHFTNEAVIEYFKFRTSLSEEDVFSLRKEFLTRLRGEFGIDKIDPDAFDDVPLYGEIDLGGGNQILGYVVNEDANQRVVTKQDKIATVAMPYASRLHEGGFRLVVGRSGIDTIDGRAAFGTTILQGVMVLENGNSDGSDAEMPFHSIGLVESNTWSTSTLLHRIEHPEYGDGQLIATQLMPKVDMDGIHLMIRGVMVFGGSLLDIP